MSTREPGLGRRLRTLDWEAIAGIAAAVLALVMHLHRHGRNEVGPKLAACSGREKSASHAGAGFGRAFRFISSETDAENAVERISASGAHRSWSARRAVRPRAIFHVQPHSELIGRLVELERRYRGTA